MRVIKAIQKLTGPWQIGDWEFATEYLNKVQKQQMMAAAARPWGDAPGSIAWIDPIMNFRVYHATMNKGSIVRYQDTGSEEDAKSVLKAVLENEIDCSTVNVVRKGDEEFQICSVTPESLESQLAAASLSKHPAKKREPKQTTPSKTQSTTSAQGRSRQNPGRNAKNPSKVKSDPEGGPSEPSSPTEQFPRVSWDDHWRCFKEASEEKICTTRSNYLDKFKLAWIDHHEGKAKIYCAEGNINSRANKCYQRYSGDEDGAKIMFQKLTHQFVRDPNFWKASLKVNEGRVEADPVNQQASKTSKERSSNASMSTPKSAGSTSKSRVSGKPLTQNSRNANKEPSSNPELDSFLGITSRTEKESPRKSFKIPAVSKTWAEIHLLWEDSKGNRKELVKDHGTKFCLVWQYETKVYTASGMMTNIPRCYERECQSEDDAEHEFTRIYNEKIEDYEEDWHIEFKPKSGGSRVTDFKADRRLEG
ncbi:hypothetical protein BJX66DRAFT_345660 [Aspergillus keveii]|uniref:Uncharacterized protein n=1 Tax=Aspergillus keveii TaxID=714993 RepID=A0ABR4FHD0_9EURO